MKKDTPVVNQIVLVIFILVLLGIVTFASARMHNKRNRHMQEQMQMNIQNDPVIQQVSTQSSSDDVASIEADLNATNVDDISK